MINRFKNYFNQWIIEGPRKYKNLLLKSVSLHEDGSHCTAVRETLPGAELRQKTVGNDPREKLRQKLGSTQIVYTSSKE